MSGVTSPRHSATAVNPKQWGMLWMSARWLASTVASQNYIKHRMQPSTGCWDKTWDHEKQTTTTSQTIKVKQILFPAWGLNSDPCTPQPLIARHVSATPPRWVSSAVSNSVVYLAAERIQRLEINNMLASLVWFFFVYKKILGQTETWTRDRIYLRRIRSVWDISRGDRARIATCSLRTPTDRLKANYSVDYVEFTQGKLHIARNTTVNHDYLCCNGVKCLGPSFTHSSLTNDNCDLSDYA